MSSVGGTLTGRGGRFIIIDDPLKPEESQSKAKRTAAKDWYDGTVFARLDDKSGDVIILVMQRLHVDDLVAHVLEKEAWVHLDLPAISELYQTIALSDGQVITREPGEVLHPERESLETLHRIEHTIGTYNFSAQYLQQPIPPEGSLIKWKWFRTYATPPGREFRDEIVQSWDTATSGSELADYSVCTTWHIHNGDYFLLDVFRDRLDFPDLRRAVIHEAQRYAADRVVIEDSGSGRALIQNCETSDPPGSPDPMHSNRRSTRPCV